MSKELTKKAYWTPVSFHEVLSHKVITRVVSDGISLKDAVREAIKVAELNKQDIFMLLANLQDSGMVHNGDFKNYWSNGWGDGVGAEGIDAHKGTNYYATDKRKVVTAEERDMFNLFDYVDTLRSFASDEEIIESNPELDEVIAIMNNTQKIVTALNVEEAAELAEKQKGQPAQEKQKEQPPVSAYQQAFKKAIDMYLQREQAGQTKPLEEIFNAITKNQYPNVPWAKLAPIIQKRIKNYTPLVNINPRGANASEDSSEFTVREAMPKPFNNPVGNDTGDKIGDENFEEDLADLEESFIGKGTKAEEVSSLIKEQSAVYKRITRAQFEFVRIANASLGKVLTAEELSYMQSALNKAMDLFEEGFQNNKPLEEVFHYVTDGKMPNVDWHKLAPLVRKRPKLRNWEPLASVMDSSSLDLVTAQQKPVAPAAAPAEDAGGLEGLGEEIPEEGTEGVEELAVEEEVPTEDVPNEDVGGTVMNVEVTPNPDELIGMAQAGPEWEISNLLSIQKAEEYYNQLKKQLEDVVLNPNILIDLNGVAAYDKVRDMIDTELNKINEASKGKEKLEKKEEELEEEINEPEMTVEEEAPVIPEENSVAPTGIQEADPTAQV
jgi:hypothetical protein